MPIASFLDRLKKGLAKTAQLFNIRAWFGRRVDQGFLDDLESRLIQADVGVAATAKIIERVREAFAEKTADENLLRFVKAELKGLLEDSRSGALAVAPKPPSVYLIAGVNGSGKTTSIAKLAKHLKDQGKTVILAACDTFRAAAADQLSVWAQRRHGNRQRGSRRRSGERGPRRLPARHRPPFRRSDRRHRRPAPYPGPSDARARKNSQRDSAADSGLAARGSPRDRCH